MAVVAATALATESQALEREDIAYRFAACAGRFSAEMEHGWLMNDPRADVIAQERSAFVKLVEAALPTGQGRAVLSHRIEVKLAHAALLQHASFATRPDRARAARRTANHHLTTCRTLLLGS